MTFISSALAMEKYYFQYTHTPIHTHTHTHTHTHSFSFVYIYLSKPHSLETMANPVAMGTLANRLWSPLK